ncbi:hypothetical protein J2Z62_000153 [Mycoplasmoides fastidiosum]|uniref:Uncharacterized protein n=1 Tax=Mycoplasmoides fastidiosum TaxID=92758 RepID=A0ABU0LYE7_9BACT|nr:hypothetical protein [Mycoplasmoides fastidiosum]MDQ0513715.1 hypothetical protein [Mycoplasmoides fastidiosum]UUD37862.1 hypothetical protein NPA10_00495 [Mycoplasmoides fastidiosum]
MNFFSKIKKSKKEQSTEKIDSQILEESKIENNEKSLSTNSSNKNQVVQESVNQENISEFERTANEYIAEINHYDHKSLMHFYHNYTLSNLNKIKPNLADFKNVYGSKIHYDSKFKRYRLEQLETIEDYQNLIKFLEQNDLIIFKNYISSFLSQSFQNKNSYLKTLHYLKIKDDNFRSIIIDFEKIAPQFFNWILINVEIEELILKRATSFDHAFIYVMVNLMLKDENFGRSGFFLLKQYLKENNVYTDFQNIQDIAYFWNLYVDQWRLALTKYVKWDLRYNSILKKLYNLSPRILKYCQSTFLQNYYDSETINFEDSSNDEENE